MRISLASLGLNGLLFGSAFAASVLGSGCSLMHQLAPENRVQDQVYALNDESHWGRVDLAAGRVARSYRQAFVASHRSWGRSIAIGDHDVTNIAMQPEGAQSLVTFQWIDQSTMELHETTVRQTWASEGEGYALVGEDIVGGDDGLYLEVPGGPRMLETDETGAVVEGGLSAGDETTVTDGSSASSGNRTLAASAPRRRDSQGQLID